MNLIEAKSISKKFGGVQALLDVDFSVQTGEIFGLIGSNGAGKTTLFSVISGFYRPDSGMIKFQEKTSPVKSRIRFVDWGWYAHFRSSDRF